MQERYLLLVSLVWNRCRAVDANVRSVTRACAGVMCLLIALEGLPAGDDIVIGFVVPLHSACEALLPPRLDEHGQYGELPCARQRHSYAFNNEVRALRHRDGVRASALYPVPHAEGAVASRGERLENAAKQHRVKGR